MTIDDSGTELLERDLRALAARQPGDEQLRLMLREQLTPPLRPAPRRRPPSLRLALPVAAALAAAAVAAIVFLGADGAGPTAASAAILHHTLAAVTPPAGKILHVKTTDVENGVQFVGEWWQETSPPYASRGTKGMAGHLAEFGDDGSTSYTYDPSTNTVYERPDSAPPTSDDPVTLIRDELANGQAHLTGTAVIDGEALYAITLSSGVVAYVDKSTYVPRYLDDPQRDGTTVRLDVVTYEYLPASTENARLLSLTAQHPGAHLDTNPSDYPDSAGK
jgi:hypothetical protein